MAILFTFDMSLNVKKGLYLYRRTIKIIVESKRYESMRVRTHNQNRWLSAINMVLAAVVLLLLGGVAQAQPNGGPAKGTVISSSDDLPIPGVNVVVKGTTNGTITDIDGNYSLNVEPGSTLVFSFIGFESQELVYTGQPLNVTLVEETSDLEEVVVVGYGVQKKKLVTGATVQVKGDDIQKLNTTNPLQAMQGQTPGVNIQSTSGQPGSSMSVSIRGLGTVGNAQPLYLIDGVGGDISTLNPADIESIDVLKDAASAAIYGAQAANGVVLVTTKSGKEGKSQVSYDGYYGIQQVYRQTRMLNSKEYMTIMDESHLNSGSGVYDWASYYQPDNYEQQLFDEEGNPLYDTDWIDEMFVDDATMQSHNISITGGSKTSTFAMSIGFMNQEGIVGGSAVSDYDRYNFRINSDHKLYDGFLTVGEHVSFIWKESRGMNTGNIYNNNLRGAFITSPLSPVYDLEGDYYNSANSPWNVDDGNPLGTMMSNRFNRTKTATVDANIYAEINPIKGLKVKTVYGISYGTSEYRSYTPIYQYTASSQQATTAVSQSQGHGKTQTWTNTASYDFTVAEEHAINVLIGMEASKYDGSGISGYNTGLISGFEDWTHAYLDNTEGTDNKTVGGAPYDDSRSASYFARLGWNWNEKYMLNATFRADGSSKFAEGNRFGYFPSVSAGWTISEESFMDNTKSVIDFFKLRASWGQVGNANIDAYQYLSPVTTSYTNYNFGSSGGQDAWVTGSYTERLANEEVQWETSEQVNVGIDARFLNSRLGLNADWYYKKTKDWLVEAPVLATSGTGAPYINGGDVKNTGVEVALTWNAEIGTTGVQYTVGANFAYNKNEVGEIPTSDGIIHGETNQIYDNAEEYYRAENGHEIGYFWGYKTAGIFQNQNEIDDWIAAGNGVMQSSVAPGDVKFVDVNHDGAIDEDDKVDLGCGIPSYTYGVNIGFNWKGFDLSAVGSGAAGFQIVQSYRAPSSALQNYSQRILNRWTGEGTSNEIPRVLDSNNGNWNFSDLYIQDGDYFRIQNITLGYDFKQLIKWKYLTQCRLYVQVQNVCTFTEYDGMDPEIGSYNGTDGNSADSWVSGVDMGYYPHPRIYLVGLNLKF